MSFVAAAVGGAGLLSAGASIYASNQASNAAGNAAALQQQQMAQNQKNVQPFITGGQGANNLLQSFYGIGGNPALGQGAMTAFQQSPDYQFALQGGTAALDNSAAAKGGMIGGNQMLAQTQYGQGLATTNLQNYLKQLTTMSGQGVSAATGIASPNTTGANNAGNYLMQGATAQGAGGLGISNAYNSTLNNYLGAYNSMNQSSYGGNVFSNPSYGGGNAFTDEFGGSSSNPIPGLTSADYG
jgi:hypothetical protein